MVHASKVVALFALGALGAACSASAGGEEATGSTSEAIPICAPDQTLDCELVNHHLHCVCDGPEPPPPPPVDAGPPPVVDTPVRSVLALAPYTAFTTQINFGPLGWGADNLGSLGDTNAPSVRAPALIQGLPGYPNNVARSIVAGVYAACALMPDSSVWCWGSNTSGLRGTPGVATAAAASPVPWPFSNVTQIAMSANYACALSGDLDVCWGSSTRTARSRRPITSSPAPRRSA